MHLKVHSTTGCSFRGVMEYLTDANVAASESRMEWCETVNLGTKDPLTASRVMAATAYSQAELKREAGVSNRGRKAAGGPVMHYSIQWREDEVEGGISKEEMLAQARKTLAVLGKDTTQVTGKNAPKHGGRRQFADQHQVVMVAHNDKAHPHVHIVVNRVHPKHGVMLPTSNDWLKLSDVGHEFEKHKNQKIVCPDREVNRESRKHGNYVKAQAELPRKTWEEMDKAAAGNEPQKKALLDQHRQKAAELSQSRRDLQQRHRTEWDRLEHKGSDRVGEIIEAREKEIKEQRSAIVKGFLDKRRESQAQANADRQVFEKREKSVLGKMKNKFESVDFKALMRLDRQMQSDPRASTFKEAFQVMSSEGARREVLDKQHELNLAAIAKEEKAALKTAIAEQRMAYQAKMSDHRQGFLQERESLVFKQKGELAKTRSEWKTFDAKRQAAWQGLHQKSEQLTPKPAIDRIEQRRQEIGRQMEAKASSAPQPKPTLPTAKTETSSIKKTQPGDLVPPSKSGAELIDQRRRQITEGLRKQSGPTHRGKEGQEDGHKQ